MARTDLTDEQVSDQVSRWLANREAGAIVRFGEGEGRLLVADIGDEESLRVAANKVKRQAGLLVDATEVLELRDLVTRALDNADVVGIRGSDWFKDEHKMWVDRIETLFSSRSAVSGATRQVAHCLVSNHLRDQLPSLLAGETRISVISSRDLGDALHSLYDADVTMYPIPSQYIMRNVDGAYEAQLHRVPIWPDFIKQLREDLTVKEPGEVFLVGAGLFGKELCIHIRELGGVALDMGSCLDGLAGKVTRGENRPPDYPPPPGAGPSSRGIARKIHPYLNDIGWISSFNEKSSIDGEGKPIPWYRYAAIDFLAERVSKDHAVFEYGCGNSTLWWSEHAHSVDAVEHNPEWAAKISGVSPGNVAIHEVELDIDGDYSLTPVRLEKEYQVLIVDGRDRVHCGINGLEALSSDGIIIWDDSHRRRYRYGLDVLKKRGFRRIRFTGLGPISPEPGETSILYRPDNCFQI
jgi:hypothetical protein